ncbi:efflux RND transporter permease subunit [Dyella jejuensis]|uniref:Efflux RND transporter permease subunit n=1 Tax=Dyella jejuensis TaxID=1432009 RepID=A0ABW8JHF4_9GAMM
MKTTSASARYARVIVLCACLLGLAGLYAASVMPVGLFPQVSFPRVVVDLDAGDRPADQTVQWLTRPVEEAVRSVPGVINVRSDTTRGSAQISVDFGWGHDMIASTLLLDAAIARILPTLPAGTSYDVRRMDPTVFPIAAYALQSSHLSSVALRDLAINQIVPLLASIPGLAQVSVQGGGVAEIDVDADPRRLAAYGLTLNDVVNAIDNANQLQAVGRVQDRNSLYLVLADHALPQKARAIGQVVIKSSSAGWLRISDIADVHPGIAPQWMQTSEDGKPAVLLNIFQQPDGNALDIATQVRQRLSTLALPVGTQLTRWYDQSDLVVASASSVFDAVWIGTGLSALVLLVFLRSLRITLVAMLTVPLILAITALLLNLLGMSFNVMTLGGIAAAVGLVIDDVIVMVEHMADRATKHVGAYEASREFLLPLSGSSAATLIVFLPLGLLGGVTGAFSKALSLTMACALFVSWLITAWVVPVLAARLIDFRRLQARPQSDEGVLHRAHAWIYDHLHRRPVIMLALLAALVVAGYVGYSRVTTGFMPDVDEGGFVLDYYTRPGTSLPETDRQAAEIEAILRQQPEVETFSRRLGTGLGGDLGQSYHGDMFVRLKRDHQRSTQDVMEAVRSRIASEVPAIQVDLAQQMEDLIGDLTAVPQPIEVKLYAADPDSLPAQARRVAKALHGIDGVVDIADGLQLAGSALDIRVDADKAAAEGTTVAAITQAINTALTGTVATQLPGVLHSIGVRVRMPDALHWRIPDVAALPIGAPDGHVFPLGRVATLTPVNGQPQQSRENLQPMIAVTARIEGRGIGAAMADVQKILRKPGLLDAGTRYELGGLYQQQQIAFAGLARVFAMALAAEFALLLLLYGRISLAIVVLGCSLFSTSAAFVALWLSGVDLNITAMMGLTMIIGIGTEMAIFLVSEYVRLEQALPTATALRQASRNRLRPIAMTTLAAIFALLPLALALSRSAGFQQPLAIVIVAGLLLQCPLVLVAMPMLIGWTHREPQ